MLSSREQNTLAKIKALPGTTVCVIFSGKQVIVGYNDRKKTSPSWTKLYNNRPPVPSSRHAEEHAIQLLSRLGDRSIKRVKKVVVLRWNKKRQLSMARPCQFCSDKLWGIGIKQSSVLFSNEEGEIERYS